MIIDTKTVTHPSKDQLNDVIDLASSIFGDGIGWEIETAFTMKSPALSVASVDGEMVGFKLGFSDVPLRFYSTTGAVKDSFRGKGVAKQLMEEQHRWCRENEFKIVRTETKNTFAAMISLNLKSGFQIIGTYTDHRGEPKIILEKKL